MRYFGCLLLLATLAFANFDLFKRDDCNKMNIAACRDAIRIKETNCDMYDNDSDYESDTEQEFYAKIQEDRDRKSTRLNSSHLKLSRMPSSA